MNAGWKNFFLPDQGALLSNPVGISEILIY
jgi:hypothetical protein